MIVASIQTPPGIFDKRQLNKTIVQLCFQAARQGAEVIVLPELSFETRKPKNFGEAVSSCDEPGGQDSEELRRLTLVYNCTIVYGYIEIEQGNLYNAACVVSGGRIVGNFRKINLSGPDHLWATQNESLYVPVITFHSYRLGVLIGDDIINYEEFDKNQRPFYNGNVDLVCHLTNKSFDEFPYKPWINFVKTTGVNLVVSNKVGNSCVISKEMKVFSESALETNIIGGEIFI